MAYDEELAERIRSKLKGKRGISEKRLFGGVGFLVGGNMACGVNKRDLIVRLSDDDFAPALKQPNVRVFDMTGRPMKGWIMVAAGGLRSDKELQSWIDKAYQYARKLPAK